MGPQKTNKKPSPKAGKAGATKPERAEALKPKAAGPKAVKTAGPKADKAAKPKPAVEADLSTEARIKAAAKRLFTQKGFDAVRTRDIAEEAGINLALLNYYFRNKKKLFDLIMWENMQLFLGHILQYFKDNRDPLDVQLQYLAEKYIDMLMGNPNLPFFVLQNMQGLTDIDLSKSMHPMFKEIGKMRNAFLEKIQASVDSGEIRPIHPLHFIANLMGMLIFPFIARNLLMSRIGNMSSPEFETLMEERKKLIPIWIKNMLAP
jgi:AcrR family transcriptional regulator